MPHRQLSTPGPSPTTDPAYGYVVLDGSTRAAVVPVVRGAGVRARTIGVVLIDESGMRWKRTVDVERLLLVGTVVAGVVAIQASIAEALRRPTARVERLTMGPGGWVSFRGGEKPKPHGLRRPWWAVLLRAQPLDTRAAPARSRGRRAVGPGRRS